MVALAGYAQEKGSEKLLAVSSEACGCIAQIGTDSENKNVEIKNCILVSMQKAKGDEKRGYDIITQVLEAPTWQIATNAGVDGDLVVEKVKEGEGGFGFNAATGDYVDMVSAGIIDPALVARTALQNAASVAGLLLTTDVVVTELKEDDDPVEEAVS